MPATRSCPPSGRTSVATERTKVVYVASLAGLLPAGPGHSHQSVRDIAALSGIPDLVMLAPGSAAEVPLALRFCLERPKGSSVLRLESTPLRVLVLSLGAIGVGYVLLRVPTRETVEAGVIRK